VKTKTLRYPTHRQVSNPRSLDQALAGGWKIRERVGLFSPNDNQLESGLDIIENPEHTVRLEVPFTIVTVHGRPRSIAETQEAGRP
jgi:hypothetical protein